MALITNYEHDGIILPDAYIRLQRCRTANVDYEKFEDLNDPNRPDIAQILTWVTRIEASGTAFVWHDKIARDNRAMAASWFEFDFTYDLESPRNIYQQAYDALKATERFKDAIDA